MQLTSILLTTAANWANLAVKMSIDGMEWDVWVYYFLQLADTWKYILKNIFICIIKEQCSDEGESTWRWYKGCQNTINDIICHMKWIRLWICPWQNEWQQRFNDFCSCIIGIPCRDWLQPFIYAVLAGSIGKRGSHTLPATIWKWASTERQRILVL